MNLVVCFVNGREKLFKVDDYCFDEEVGYLKLYSGNVEIGMIAINQIVFWFVEVWWKL